PLGNERLGERITQHDIPHLHERSVCIHPVVAIIRTAVHVMWIFRIFIPGPAGSPRCLWTSVWSRSPCVPVIAVHTRWDIIVKVDFWSTPLVIVGAEFFEERIRHEATLPSV